MEKFNRNYVLTVETPAGVIITIKPPFTVEFDVTRNVLSSANVFSVKIYNLSEENRNQIRKDITDYYDLRLITLRAGYGDNMPIICTGNINQAWSAREGTNMITQMECFDGGFAFTNGITNQQFPADTKLTSMIKGLTKDLPGVTLGAVGEYAGELSRGASFSGSTTSVLSELSSDGFFIDNGVANYLGTNECLQGDVQVINSDSGLLGTPIREQTIINFDMLFEPAVKIGQLIKLESITGANFNGFYKVISIKHRGMISGSVSGDAITSVGLFYGTEALKIVGT